MKQITILGAGLVGSLLAINLAKRGYSVKVFERRPDMRKEKIIAGRSINLALSDRGWKGLEVAGLKESIHKIAIPMPGRMIHTTDGSQNFQPYGKEGQAIYSVSRGALNMELMNLAEQQPNVKFFFNQWADWINLEKGEIRFSAQSEIANSQSEIIFGADGAFSRIRHRMQRQSMFNYSQEFLKLGYKELHIPANADGSHKLDKNSLHIWPRGEYMLMALANTDGTFTCTLFMPHEGENSFAQLKDQETLEAFFAEHFPDTAEVIPDLVEDFFKNPTSFLVTMKCFPWTYQDKVALIGDACHAIVPFYGHGMNAGFEDITILHQMMQQYGDDWQMIFSEYEKSRKPNADAIAELSYRNFMEMSTKTADAQFLLQKKIEKWFSEKHPDKWLPLYSRVTFSLRPYSEALAIGNRQNEIMETVMKSTPDIENLWNSPEVEQKILDLLAHS